MSVRTRPYRPGIAAVIDRAYAYRDRLAEDIAADSRRYAPVLSGELRASIRTVLGGRVARIWWGDVAADVNYHLYQEFGTSRMAAQPYIRPAVYQYRSA